MHTTVSFGAEFIPPHTPRLDRGSPVLCQLVCSRYGLGTVSLGMRYPNGKWNTPLITDEKWWLSSPPRVEEFRDMVRRFIAEVDSNYPQDEEGLDL